MFTYYALVIMGCLDWMLNYADFRFCGCLWFSEQGACFWKRHWPSGSCNENAVFVPGGSGVARSFWPSGRVITMSALKNFTNFKTNRIYLLGFLIFDWIIYNLLSAHNQFFRVKYLSCGPFSALWALVCGVRGCRFAPPPLPPRLHLYFEAGTCFNSLDV